MVNPLGRTKTSPIAVIKSRRSHELRGLTSLPAGKMTPIAAIPLLREDALQSSSIRLSFEMAETVEILMNSVHVAVKAYLVPHLAFERFSGMDELNRSFAGLPNQEGGAVTPYIETSGALYANPIHKYLGKHTPVGANINTAYVEAYNQIWNFRAKNRSANITQRARLETSLAPAFWQHQQFNHIVPNFDQSVIDGEVGLNVIPGTQLRVKSKTGFGIMVQTEANANHGSLRIKADGSIDNNGTAPATAQRLELQNNVNNIYAEMAGAGITVSLSNIEMARKMQSFAKLREQFAGHTDEYIIDMLMDGLSIPEQAFRQPILLAEKSTVFGMSKRYASDSGNLTESVVNGMTGIDMNIRCPQVPMGGIIMVVAEITPEQLFERQIDPYLALTSAEQMPHYLRDTLDPEKVEVVKNSYVDVAHSLPNATFGYAPLNHQWNVQSPCIGGKFHRPTVNTTFDEDRQRIWSVETVNPSLSADFYLCNAMHQKPFVVTNQDPFEVVFRGGAVIAGNTVFGGMLHEGTVDWDEVLEEVDQTRIVQP